MDWHDCARARRHAPPHVIRIQEPVMLPNLGKHWGPPCLDNCIDRRDVCEGRHDNLISGLQVQAMQCHMQGRGPVTYGANVLRPDPRSYRSLEAIKELPAR